MRKIVITGASRGIGAEMVRQLTERGEDVVGTSRSGKGAHLDVTNAASLNAFAASLEGPIDDLVCNAGVFVDRHQALEGGYDADLWAQTFETNVTGVFRTVQALLPHLERAGAPRIAIIASRMGSNTHAKGNALIYRVSKAAAINLGTNLAALLEPKGIAVGIYHPGWVRTDMGGAEADIDVQTSASGLISNLDGLDMSKSGKFLNYDGTPLPF